MTMAMMTNTMIGMIMNMNNTAYENIKAIQKSDCRVREAVPVIQHIRT